ncbi:hypothetical protein C1T17_08050 [Sphingobium sp. SCG-1]|uniref:DUF6456 domain-containing protein n=1 Tax=Sphingobium sp. SCG-1 TaxID=2072936 RepID=UPI000CD6AB4E|nr:DUF6456 domain-containing protein [Sphingobium sp. SCG-1]AUW58067.1 hypothetical protein C1T17_08050 [Sphingobium sp. SCG-1]
MSRQFASYIEQTIEDPNGEHCVVLVNRGESPITWLHVRGKITERQYLAAETLRRDWERAGLGPQVTMHWNPAPVAKGRHGAPRAPDPTLAQMSARDRFTAAIDAAGPGLSDILWRVACAGEGLGAAEKALHWPTRAGKLVLTLALDRIADFYRMR